MASGAILTHSLRKQMNYTLFISMSNKIYGINIVVWIYNLSARVPSRSSSSNTLPMQSICILHYHRHRRCIDKIDSKRRASAIRANFPMLNCGSRPPSTNYFETIKQQINLHQILVSRHEQSTCSLFAYERGFCRCHSERDSEWNYEMQMEFSSKSIRAKLFKWNVIRKIGKIRIERTSSYFRYARNRRQMKYISANGKQLR